MRVTIGPFNSIESYWCFCKTYVTWHGELRLIDGALGYMLVASLVICLIAQPRYAIAPHQIATTSYANF